MLTAFPAVFDRGRPSAGHTPSDAPPPSSNTPLHPKTFEEQQETTIFSTTAINTTSGSSSSAATQLPVPGLHDISAVSSPSTRSALLQPSRHATTNRRPQPLHTFFLSRWLPTSCASSCFYSLGTQFSFPGSNRLIPIATLQATHPYTYECTCWHDRPSPGDSTIPTSQETVLQAQIDELTARLNEFTDRFNALSNTNNHPQQPPAVSDPAPEPNPTTPSTMMVNTSLEHQIAFETRLQAHLEKILDTLLSVPNLPTGLYDPHTSPQPVILPAPSTSTINPSPVLLPQCMLPCVYHDGPGNATTVLEFPLSLASFFLLLTITLAGFPIPTFLPRPPPEPPPAFSHSDES